jgi:hypothetical protein
MYSRLIDRRSYSGSGRALLLCAGLVGALVAMMASARGTMTRVGFVAGVGLVVVGWLPLALSAFHPAHRVLTVLWLSATALVVAYWLWLGGDSFVIAPVVAVFGAAFVGFALRPPARRPAIGTYSIAVAGVTTAAAVYAFVGIPTAPAGATVCYDPAAPVTATNASFDAASRPTEPGRRGRALLPGVSGVVAGTRSVRIHFDTWATDSEVRRVLQAQAAASPYVVAILRDENCSAS